MNHVRGALRIAAFALLSACANSPPDAPHFFELPERSLADLPIGPYTPMQWWKSFDDPLLNKAIDTALASNLQLEQALARVAQARARARIARATRFPSAMPTATATRTLGLARLGLHRALGGAWTEEPTLNDTLE